MSESIEAVRHWLRDGLLPATLLFGGALLVRLAKWALGAYRRRLSTRIALWVDEEDVASESLKRRLAVAQAVDWAFSAAVYLVAGVLALRATWDPTHHTGCHATVVGVGLGFGAQQVVGDLLTGSAYWPSISSA